MTLILSLITPEFACHVSDRRLTDGLTGKPMVSRASKTVIVPAAQFMVSYTGLARIRQMTMDEWLLRTLWSVRESEDFFGSLAAAASEAFKSIAVPRSLKRHGFLISGWIGNGEFATDAPLPEGFTLSGYATYVTNTLDLERGVELIEASDTFVHRTRPLLPAEPFSIFAAGVPLTEGESDELERSVAAALRSPGGGVRAAAVAMIRTVDRVSTRASSVGGGTFVCAVPRHYRPLEEAAGFNVMGVKWGLPEAGAATFLHAPDRPTQEVESPGIIADPFAGHGTLVVKKGTVPSIAGVDEVPEEAEMRMRLIALRSSEELAQLAEGQGAES
jgi:hypothetical protein